jgi:hypothetical protein
VWRRNCHYHTAAHYYRCVISTVCMQVGFGGFAMRNLSKRLMTAYFNSNPTLFYEIFGFPR